MTTIGQMAIGDSAQVKNIAGTDEISIRLMEMGLTPGVEVVLIGAAPLGDPLELEVRGYRLSLRRSEADRVEIAPA